MQTAAQIELECAQIALRRAQTALTRDPAIVCGPAAGARPTGRHDPMGALCQYLLWLGSACPPVWQVQARETLRLRVLTFLADPSPADPAPPALPEPVVAMVRTGPTAR